MGAPILDTLAHPAHSLRPLLLTLSLLLPSIFAHLNTVIAEQDFLVWTDSVRAVSVWAVSVWGHSGHDISVHKQLISLFIEIII